MKKPDILQLMFTALMIVACASIYVNISRAEDTTLASRLSGKILLQVENNGEAWYVNPVDRKRYYLGRPDDAFALMKDMGLGITNEDLRKIPVAEANFGGADSDNDGLSDAVEAGLGTDKNDPDTDGDGYGDKEEILCGFDPLGPGTLTSDPEKSKNLAGRIVLQVESTGEAWYISPDNLKRYYMGRPADAFDLMRSLSLGITNGNLAKITEYHPDPKFETNYLVENYTKPVSNLPGVPAQSGDTGRQYYDINNKFSLIYPSGWNIKRHEEMQNALYLTDSDRDFFLEKKAVIIIVDGEKNAAVALDKFFIAGKPEAKKIENKKIEINDYQAMIQGFQYDNTYERMAILEKSPKEFAIIKLVTSNYNNASYENVYDNILSSLKFTESSCQTCQ